MNLSQQLIVEVLGVVQQFKSREDAQTYIDNSDLIANEVEVVQSGDQFQISLILI